MQIASDRRKGKVFGRHFDRRVPGNSHGVGEGCLGELLIRFQGRDCRTQPFDNRLVTEIVGLFYPAGAFGVEIFGQFQGDFHAGEGLPADLEQLLAQGPLRNSSGWYRR